VSWCSSCKLVASQLAYCVDVRAVLVFDIRLSLPAKCER